MANPIPHGPRVIVRLIEPESESRLMLPPGVSVSPAHGFIEFVGPGYMRADGDYMPLDLHPGDEVLFHENNGIKLRLAGHDDDVVLLEDRHVLVVVNPARTRAQA